MYAQNVHIKEKGAIAERKNNKCKKKGMIYIMDKIAGVIAHELGVKEFQVQNTIKLIDDGNTIPFIARYRKEATGGLSDEVLRNLNDRLTYLRNLNKRKEEISKSIEEQGKMTDELKIQIENAITLSEVEDIYRPYKQKKRTRASIAKEKGLEPLATIIYLQTDKRPVLEIAKEFINEEKGVNNEEEALTGAKDIIAENISDVAEYRKRIPAIRRTVNSYTTPSWIFRNMERNRPTSLEQLLRKDLYHQKGQSEECNKGKHTRTMYNHKGIRTGH